MYVIIDGLDVAGKETLTKLVVDELVSRGKTVKTVAFPRYDTDLGKCIKSELCKPESERDIPKLIGMFCEDRLNYLDSIAGDSKDTIYVFDRYSACNVLYNYHLVEDKGIASALSKETSYSRLEDIAYTNGKSILNVYIGHDSSLSKRKHKKYIDLKVNKDANETFAKQVVFNDNMQRAIHDCTIPMPDKFIGVGFDMCNVVYYMCEDIICGLDDGRYLVSRSSVVGAAKIPTTTHRGVPKSYTAHSVGNLGLWCGDRRPNVDSSARESIERVIPEILKGVADILVNGDK